MFGSVASVLVLRAPGDGSETDAVDWLAVATVLDAELAIAADSLASGFKRRSSSNGGGVESAVVKCVLANLVYGELSRPLHKS